MLQGAASLNSEEDPTRYMPSQSVHAPIAGGAALAPSQPRRSHTDKLTKHLVLAMVGHDEAKMLQEFRPHGTRSDGKPLQWRRPLMPMRMRSSSASSSSSSSVMSPKLMDEANQQLS